jgi:hypothetical protein
MPELELDTVWEAGEMSTGDEIDGSSSVYSSKNNEETVVVVDQPNISRPSHKLQNEATTVATKNMDSVLQVVTNKIDVNKVETKLVHEQSDVFVTRGSITCNDNLISSQISNNENLSSRNTSPSSSECNELNFSEMQKTYEHTIQIER